MRLVVDTNIIFSLFRNADSFKEFIKHNDLIDTIHTNISNFGNWDKDYMYGTVYDLQKPYLRKDLEKWGFDYDEG